MRWDLLSRGPGVGTFSLADNPHIGDPSTDCSGVAGPGWLLIPTGQTPCGGASGGTARESPLPHTISRLIESLSQQMRG